MKNIGVIGQSFLVNKNRMIFQQLGIETVMLNRITALEQLDGLLITAWHEKEYGQLIRKWSAPIKEKAAENLVIMGAALGAYSLSRQGVLKIMAVDAKYQEQDEPSTGILEIPSLGNIRFNATFMPTITFSNLAPNLGVL